MCSLSRLLAYPAMAGLLRGESQGPLSFPLMPRKGRAGILDGQTIATVKDKFGEDRRVVQRGRRIAIANNESTAILAMHREVATMVATRIKAARLKRGFSLEELAIRAGMTGGWPKNRMHDIEAARGQGTVRLGTLYALAAAMSIEATELLPPVSEVLAKANVQRATARLVTLTSRGKVSA